MCLYINYGVILLKSYGISVEASFTEYDFKAYEQVHKLMHPNDKER